MMDEDKLSELLRDRKWAHILRIQRSRAEQNPDLFKEVVNLVTHGTPIGHPLTVDQIDFLKDMEECLEHNGRESLIFEMMRKVAQRIEYDESTIRDRHKMSKDKIPAFNPSLLNICTADWILELMRKKNFGKNTTRFINRCKKLSQLFLERESQIVVLNNNSSCGFQWEGFNIRDITGICMWNQDTDRWYPMIQNYLKIVVRRKWKFIPYTNHGVSGVCTVVPDNEGGERLVYMESPWKQLISKGVANWLGYIARRIDANGTTEQMRWVVRAIKREWNKYWIIISADMKKYSDTLLRKVLLDILDICGLIPNSQFREELDQLWSGDVWDKIRGKINGSDDEYHSLTLKQGQYSIFDAMTICNLFMQCIIYDEIQTSNTFLEDGKIISKNSAVGDDTVLGVDKWKNKPIYELSPEDQDQVSKEILGLVQDAFSYLGVKLNYNKTKILTPSNNGTIDFVKRIVTSNGLIPYVNPNVLSKGQFDDFVNEYRRLKEDETLLGADHSFSDRFGDIYLGKYKDRFNNLHRINGGLREDAIIYEDLLLFEYRFQRYRRQYEFKNVKELTKTLDWIKSKIGLLSETALILWSNDPYQDPSEDVDQEIVDNITHASQLQDPLDVDLTEILGKTWEEVQDEPIIQWMESSIRDIEYRDRKKKRSRTLYKEVLDVDLSELTLSRFIKLSGFPGSTLAEYNAYREKKRRMTNYQMFISVLRSHNLLDLNESYHQQRPLLKARWNGMAYTCRLYLTRSETRSGSLNNRSSYGIVPLDLFKVIVSHWLPNWGEPTIDMYWDFIWGMPEPMMLDEWGEMYYDGLYS